MCILTLLVIWFGVGMLLAVLFAVVLVLGLYVAA